MGLWIRDENGDPVMVAGGTGEPGPPGPPGPDGKPGADGQDGADGTAGPHDHDYLPLSGGTVTGDLTVNGNSDLKINVPDDYWSRTSGTVFSGLGMLGGTQGAYATSMTSNGYRNTSGTWTSMGNNGNAGAVQISLMPTGSFQVCTAANHPTGAASNPPIRLTIDADKTRMWNDLQVDGVLYGSNGHQGQPSLCVGGYGSKSGWYGNDLGVAMSVNGSYKINVGPTFFQTTVQNRAISGSYAAPSYSFTSNTSSGMCSINRTSTTTGAGCALVAEDLLALYVRKMGEDKMGHDNRVAACYVPAARNYSTTAKANTFVGSDGLLHYSTATRASMTEVEPVTRQAVTNVLDLEPIWYRSTCDGDNPAHSQYGFAAEDVAEVDPRLATHTEDDDGNLVPDNVDYGAITALLVSVVKEQRDQIAELTARLDKLEGKA